MRIARWYYVQEPVFPPGNLFHHPALIEQMLNIVRENPGLTVGDIADRMGKADHYVETILWRLKKYTGSLDRGDGLRTDAGAGGVQEGAERPEDGL